MKKVFDNFIFRYLFIMIKILFVVLLIIYLLFVIISRLSENRSIMGYRLFTITSSSMADVYSIDEVIAVKDFDINKLKVDDDISYMGERGGLEGKVITNKIVKIEKGDNGEKIFITKGVNSKVEDPSITSKQIIGKVVGVVPIVSQINYVVKRQMYFFFLVFCPLLLIIILEILQTIMDIKLDKSDSKKIEVTSNLEPVIISSEAIVEEPVIISNAPLLEKPVRDDVKIVEERKKSSKTSAKSKENKTADKSKKTSTRKKKKD